MNKNTQWMCDNCGKIIENVSDGWIEWIEYTEEGQRKGRGLRIVHNDKKCMYNEQEQYKIDGGITRDSNLVDFLDTDGLMRLLELLNEGIIPKSEIIEIIKRIHIEDYEATYKYFEEAIDECVFEPNSKKGFYLQNDIKTVKEWLEQK